MRQVFQDYLALKDLRLTKQREKILDVFLSAERHLSQDDVYRLLKKDGLGRVTVYRTLKLLEESRLAEGVTSSSGETRFEIQLERPHHDHLICVQCGYIKEIRWPEIEKIQKQVCRKLGFSILYHRHELFGRCKDCSPKPPAAGS
ncbi:MAG: hypothetical protein A3G41_03175 [Elusimicrobia bacterium RIFCSPLOWO2_12_FULL_59_9]|nr:MAG: hypothetical protein A3G41_03175 [Elusimicrobia bacterium RIFCSPLOWO2_12_FULL_59_9]